MADNVELVAGDGHRLDAYYAAPADRVRGRLVVIQEIFGVNGHIRDVCERFAAQGYAALAPALFDRLERGVELDYTEAGLTRGREIRTGIPWQQAMRDVEAARAHLAGEGPTGIVGYCWGGSVAWLGAAECDFACAVGYYGGQIIDLVERPPRCPTVLHFGELDAAIPLQDVDAIRAAHPEVAVFLYEGADHGFNCDRRSQYHAASARLAAERTLAFLAQHLAAG